VTTVGVVTGAASGIGKACAEALHGTVDELLLVDLRPFESPLGRTLIADITGDLEPLAEAVASMGTLRSVAHAAGISPEMANWQAIVKVDLVGPALLLEALKPLVARGTAAVCFASMASQMLVPEARPELDRLVDAPLDPGLLESLPAELHDPAVAYAWAKRGVQRLVRRESLTWGGRLCSISPGIVDTAMGNQELDAHPEITSLVEIMPVPRMASARELAAVATFLLSDAASYITGVDLLVDGGAVAAFYGGS
jgi:NAD(P)-dependent dehydrogenase (short-subunit alcohol dehydrogenase family)